MNRVQRRTMQVKSFRILKKEAKRRKATGPTKNDLLYAKLHAEEDELKAQIEELFDENAELQKIIDRNDERIEALDERIELIWELQTAYNNGEDILLHKLQSNPPEN